MERSKRERRAAATRAAVRERLSSDPRGLPMEPREKPSLDEWLEFRDRRDFHHQNYYQQTGRDYAAGWRRPSPKTASRVWRLLAPAMDLRLGAFMPPAYILDHLTADQRAEVELTVRQALVITLDYAVRVGRQRYWISREREIVGDDRVRKVRRALVTKTGLFDQLAERWSDNYRAERERCSGIRARDMAPETARTSPGNRAAATTRYLTRSSRATSPISLKWSPSTTFRKITAAVLSPLASHVTGRPYAIPWKRTPRSAARTSARVGTPLFWRAAVSMASSTSRAES
jgi:hypothetical protein